MALTFDAKKNFAYSVIAVAPVPAASGTSLQVAPGDGAKFPAAPFNAVIWPASVQPTTTNAEVVRVTNKATDTFTITRAQESSSARTIVLNDQIMVGPTAKTLTDIEDAFQTASATTCPVGSIMLWATNSAPTGWLLCDGSAVSRTTYATLFALWSTTFGVGDGSTTFNLPDMRSRIAIGRHSGVAALDTIGETQGSWDHTHGPGSLTVASHTHGPGTLTAAAHQHGPGSLTVAAHTHGPGTFSTSSVDQSHTHTMAHDHSFSGTTDSESGTTSGGVSGGDFSSLNPGHTHTFSGTTGGASNSTTSSSLGSHSHSVDSGTTASTAPAVTGGVTGFEAPAVNAGVTAATAPAVSAGVTAAGNPPVLVLNYIVRALSTV